MKHSSLIAASALSLLLFGSAISASAEEHSHEEKDEAHVELPERVLKASGISMERASAATIRVTMPLLGRLVPNEDRVAHMMPRYPGLVKDVRKRLGESVAKGEILANIESNQTLQPYSLPSLISGVVTARHATLGEFVDEQTELFIVADYSELFADFSVFADQSANIQLGQKILIRFDDLPPLISSISLLSPVIDIDTQSRFARAVVANPDLRLQPGGFVNGELVISEETAPIAVRQNAIQMVEGVQTVFVQKAGKLLPRTVVTGRRDSQTVEILSGVERDEEYATGNTFVLKAELSKGEAKHDH